ncbi:uncharacterized protein [Prorops nasuta]|uniref:uncharacterized protein n=1 Tax=Prorops nasuta TaxID=863751 RepID=UPI0034CF0732
MAANPVIDPEIPYVGEIDGGLIAGKMVTVKGRVPPEAVRFAINYQLGPNLNPRDDIAIHVSPRFPEGFLTRNHIQSMSWGPEENEGPMPIQPGQEFEVIILCETTCFKIAVNGRHFTEFRHRLPYSKITHLVIDGDVHVNSINFGVINVGGSSAPMLDDFGPPMPGGLYPTVNPNIPPGGYGPPSGYGPPGGYGPPPQNPYGTPGQFIPPGQEKAEEEDVFSGCLDKMGLALGGLVAAGGAAAVMHALNKKKEGQEEDQHEKTDASKSQTEGGLGNLGSLGMALASSLAGSALSNNAHAQQGYPPQEAGGGVLGSLLGALGSGGRPQPAYQSQQPGGDLGGVLGSVLGGVLGGGGSHQQPSYTPSGGYGGHQDYQGGYGSQGNAGNDLLSGIGARIGSSLLNSAFEGLSKHGKDKSDDYPPSSQPQEYNAPPRSPRQTYAPSHSDNTPPSSGGKLTASEISKGLGFSDDED